MKDCKDKKKDNIEHSIYKSDFSYSLGYVLGCLSNEEITNFLEQKGVSLQEIHDVKDSINKLSRIFYQS